MVKHLTLFLFIVFAAAAVVNAVQPPTLTRFEFREPHMGTMFRIVLYAPDEAAAKKAARAAFARVAELNAIMSDYLPESELNRLCKQGGRPVPVSPDLFRVLQESQKFAEMSDGAFDASIGPVVRLWRRVRRSRQMPKADEIKQALERVDYRKIRLDPDGRTAQLLLVGMLLDLGGIAKGYAADAVLEVLRQHGITRALVAAGGDIATGDAPPGAAGWKVGIAPLKKEDAPPTHYLLLKNMACSTSGDAEQAVEIGGTRYSHIIDPKTGLGLVGRRSATVIAPNATTTDALATVVAVLGRERGLQFIESRPDLAAFVMFETDRGVASTASRRFAKYLHPDTTTE